MLTATGPRADSFVFASPGAPDVVVHACVPARLGAGTRLAVVMHGRLRNAADYIRAWGAWAERTDHVVLAPRFDRASWPGAHGYNLGNVFSAADGSGRLLPTARWSFTVVERLCAHARSAFGLGERPFALWGHSAGAQFVHRFLLLRPEAPVRSAIVAGAGWYTVPDRRVPFPYGLAHPRLAFSTHELGAYLRRPLTIMRGDLDTLADRDLRRTPGAEAQGRDRFERAAHFHRRALAADARCAWRLVDVGDVGHDWERMAHAAQSVWEDDLSSSAVFVDA